MCLALIPAIASLPLAAARCESIYGSYTDRCGDIAGLGQVAPIFTSATGMSTASMIVVEVVDTVTGAVNVVELPRPGSELLPVGGKLELS